MIEHQETARERSVKTLGSNNSLRKNVGIVFLSLAKA